MVFALISLHIGFLKNVNLVVVTLWLTGFLSVLNIGLAVLYRKRKVVEKLSYYVALGVELIIFAFALLLRVRAIHHVPFPLPPGLPIDRAEIGAAIAIAIGLFPATYWHRISLSEVGTRIAEDAKTLKEHDGSIRVEPKAPSEWMN
ncbi:MAG TPA: hypothetical protein DHW02_24805 [Ktedonobacter sp.]|nr:hypothetical protein [Ktedonobacter sp.]